MKKLTKSLLIVLLICLFNNCFCQQKDSSSSIRNQPDNSLTELKDLPSSYYSKVDKRITSVNAEVTKKSLKYLAKFQRQEKRIQQKMQRLNPDIVITDADQKYNELTQEIKSKTAGVTRILSGIYVPNIDSLGNSLSFLKQVKSTNSEVNGPLTSFNLLKGKLRQSEQIQAFLAARKNQIKETLSKYTNIPGRLKNKFAQLNKTEFYYKAQIQQYKESLKDPKKIEQATLSILDKIPAFQKFMKENGQLGNLFGIPSNYNTSKALQGLQTTDQVGQLVKSRIGSRAGATQMLQQQVQAAQRELSKFKNKLTQLGEGSGDIAMPDFVPQNEKTRPFLKRLEYGFNIQTIHTSYNFPATTNFGGSIGYKWKNQITVGWGLSYAMGWGNGVQHVQITSQGIGVRSFFAYEVKKKHFSITGGWECNYQQPFSLFTTFPKSDSWLASGLVGIMKQIDIKSKAFKKTNVQLLWNFLSYKQPVRTPALIFRVGYTF